MRVIRLFEILVGYALLLIFAAALVGGVFLWPFFLVAAAALIGYFLWEHFCLRCPWCRSAVEPSQLLRGLRHPCHCPACGHEITVVVRLDPNVPEHAAPPRSDDFDGSAEEENKNVTKPVSGIK